MPLFFGRFNRTTMSAPPTSGWDFVADGGTKDSGTKASMTAAGSQAGPAVAVMAPHGGGEVGGRGKGEGSGTTADPPSDPPMQPNGGPATPALRGVVAPLPLPDGDGRAAHPSPTTVQTASGCQDEDPIFTELPSLRGATDHDADARAALVCNMQYWKDVSSARAARSPVSLKVPPPTQTLTLRGLRGLVDNVLTSNNVGIAAMPGAPRVRCWVGRARPAVGLAGGPRHDRRLPRPDAP